MLPTIEVSRLSSASSFYSAVTHSLGIRYLSTLPTLPASSSSSVSSLKKQAPTPPPTQPSLTFGTVDTKEPLFQIRQVAPTQNRPLKTCRLALSADSLDAVNDFHAAALKAYPRSEAVIGTRASLENDSATAIGAAAGDSLDNSEVCARVTDHDGNTMEVSYLPPSSYSYSPHYGGTSSSRHRQLNDYNSNRVLHWSYDTPSAEVSHSYGGRSGSSRYREVPDHSDYYYYDTVSPSSTTRYHGGGTSTLRRSATSTSAAPYDTASPRRATREHSKGLTGGGMASMLGMAAVGAAAGAALTYSVMRSSSRSRSRSSRERGFDEVTAVPTFERRSTFPDALPPYSASRYGSNEGMRSRSRKESREVEDLYEYDNGRSRYSSSRQYRTGGSSGGSTHGSRARASSESPLDRAPLMLSSAEGRPSGSVTYVSGRRGSAAPPYTPQRGATFDYGSGDAADRGERGSYVSGMRSHRTVRGSGGGGSRLASTPPNASRSGSLRQGVSRSGSYMSAHNVPLPASGVGSSHARWEDEGYQDDDRILYDDDDNDSLAPSDSISCVGSRGRRYR